MYCQIFVTTQHAARRARARNRDAASNKVHLSHSLYLSLSLSLSRAAAPCSGSQTAVWPVMRCCSLSLSLSLSDSDRLTWMHNLFVLGLTSRLQHCRRSTSLMAQYCCLVLNLHLSWCACVCASDLACSTTFKSRVACVDWHWLFAAAGRQCWGHCSMTRGCAGSAATPPRVVGSSQRGV